MPRRHPQILRGSEGAAKPSDRSGGVPPAPRRWILGRMTGPSFLSGVWEGFLERKPGRQVAERHRIQGEQQRKQTNRALCGCRLAAQKGSRLVGGEGGGGRRGLQARPVLWAEIGGWTSLGWAAREQGVPLCVDRLLESAWLCPSPATSLLNKSGLVCPPTGAESLTQDWGDSHLARLAWPVM